MFDITSLASFLRINEWFQNFQDRMNGDKVVKMLLGNKTDMVNSKKSNENSDNS